MQTSIWLKYLECLKVFSIKVTEDPKVFGQFLPRWTNTKWYWTAKDKERSNGTIKNLKNLEHLVSKVPAAGWRHENSPASLEVVFVISTITTNTTNTFITMTSTGDDVTITWRGQTGFLWWPSLHWPGRPRTASSADPSGTSKVIPSGTF